MSTRPLGSRFPTHRPKRLPMHDHDLDQAALAIAQQLHATPQHHPGAARALGPNPEQLADQIRPHLTSEVVEMLSGQPAGAAGKNPSTPATSTATLNKTPPLGTPLTGFSPAPPIPPITIPTGSDPNAPIQPTP